jgi:hypothetical protein
MIHICQSVMTVCFTNSSEISLLTRIVKSHDYETCGNVLNELKFFYCDFIDGNITVGIIPLTTCTFLSYCQIHLEVKTFL